MPICGIYKIISPSGKIYIGQSVNCYNRVSVYRYGKCRKQYKLYNSILKHGWDNHKFEIIHQCTREELNDLEVYYIQLYQSFNTKHGMNLTSGGGVFKMSDETKQKLRIAFINSGRKPPYKKGRLFTEEQRKNMSISAKNKPPMSEETRNKFRIASTGRKMSKEAIIKSSNKRKGSKRTLEQRRKMSLARLGKDPWNKGKKGCFSEDARRKMRESHLGHISPNKGKIFINGHYITPQSCQASLSKQVS